MGLEKNASLNWEGIHRTYEGNANRAAIDLGISVSDVIFYWREHNLSIRNVGRPKGTVGAIYPTFDYKTVDRIIRAYYVCDGNASQAEKLIHKSRQIITHYWKILDLPIRPIGRPRKSQ